ncbi:hypothetical protein FRC04_006262 [Tulasnella sp. 424]|nr:hypothetical protein FRC04_006262 [Tulasnella sp. 424]
MTVAEGEGTDRRKGPDAKSRIWVFEIKKWYRNPETVVAPADVEAIKPFARIPSHITSTAATTAADLATNEATAQVNAVAVEPGFKARPFRVVYHFFLPTFTPQVFAGNLTCNTDEAALVDFFQEFSADIAPAQIIFHGHRSAGYGFVTFNTEDATDKTIASLDKKELNGRAVIVERAKPLEGSKAIPGEATEPKADGETPAAATDGAAQADAAKPKKKEKSNKRKAKKPSNAEETSGEAPADGTVAPADASADANAPAEHTRRYRKAKAPRRPRGEAPTGEPSTSVLFVANLAFSVDEAQLTEFFTSAGVTVKSARVVRWRWGTPRKSKGYAFVDVGGPEEQQKAMDAVSGKSIADRELSQLAHHTSLAWPGEIKPMSIVKLEPIVGPHLVKWNEPEAILPRNVGDIINDSGQYDARPRMRNHFGRGSSTCTEIIQQVALGPLIILPTGTFEETSMPVVDMYREQGKLVETIPEVYVEVKVAMDAKFAGTGVAPKA